MAGFEPESSVIGGDRSANCANEVPNTNYYFGTFSFEGNCFSNGDRQTPSREKLIGTRILIALLGSVLAMPAAGWPDIILVVQYLTN